MFSSKSLFVQDDRLVIVLSGKFCFDLNFKKCAGAKIYSNKLDKHSRSVIVSTSVVIKYLSDTVIRDCNAIRLLKKVS